jgi:hypothetical protein
MLNLKVFSVTASIPGGFDLLLHTLVDDNVHKDFFVIPNPKSSILHFTLLQKPFFVSMDSTQRHAKDNYDMTHQSIPNIQSLTIHIENLL